jgi:hypothetical protein
MLAGHLGHNGALARALIVIAGTGFAILARGTIGPVGARLAVARFAVGTRLTIAAWFTLRAVLAVRTPILIARLAFGALVAVAARLARGALIAGIVAVAALLHLLFAGADGIALVTEIVRVAVETVGIEIVAVAARLFFEPSTLVADHAEIMVRELQIIFGGDAVALTLRIRGHVLVLFVQLAGIATGAAVDPVAIVAATLALTATVIAATATAGPIIATTAASPTGLPIVDQAVRPCRRIDASGVCALPGWRAKAAAGLPHDRRAQAVP